jgi:uncharacterized protein YbjT (DUF2867 family)
MIFITGAAGKTGRAILQSLTARSIPVKALVRSTSQAESLKSLSNVEFIYGDLRDPSGYESSIKDCDSIYCICPNVSPDELQIGKSLIEIAKKYHFKRFLYHSVLHPQIEDMPHHWQKMRMEETLFKSGLDFTILQPCAYMQNILSGWQSILNEGKYIVPYNPSARLSIVDLEDIGKAAARIIAEEGFSNAIFELAGPEPLSQVEVADKISKKIYRQVKAVELSRHEWKQNSLRGGMDEDQVNVLLKMFEYYDKFGLVGNSVVLEHLLGNQPTSFEQFLARISVTGNGK